MKKKGYRIGELANLSGVNAQTIRRYEQLGILKCDRDEENNYRFYDPVELCTVLRSRLYRNYGFSLDEVSELLKGNISDNIQLFSSQREKITDEIKIKECQLECLAEQQKKLIDSIHEERCVITERPEMLAIYYRDKNQLLDEDLIAIWVQYMPMVRPFISFDAGAVYGHPINNHTGLCIPKKYADYLSVPTNSSVFTVEKKPCIYTTIKLHGNWNDVDRALQHIKEYCEQKNLKVTGTAYGSTFFNTRKNDEIESIQEVWLEI